MLTLYILGLVELFFFSDTESFCYPLAEVVSLKIPFAYLHNQCNISLCSGRGTPLSSLSEFRDFLRSLCEGSLDSTVTDNINYQDFSSIRKTIDFSLSFTS